MAFQTVEIDGKTYLLATDSQVTALLAQILLRLKRLRKLRTQLQD